jgi:hypothetical protein
MKKFEFISRDFKERTKAKEAVKKTKINKGELGLYEAEPFEMSSLQNRFAYINDKRDAVAKQIDEFSERYNKAEYIKMNSVTQNLLRTYFSYEVSYVTKGKFKINTNGTILSKGIILSENVPNFVMIPVTTANNNKKFKFLSQDSL